MCDVLDTFDCQVLVPGWRLHLASLSVTPNRDRGNVMDLATSGAFRALKSAGDMDDSGMPLWFREAWSLAGLDPAKYPPSSQQLAQRAREQGGIDRGCLAWEFLSVLVLKSGVPWVALDRRVLHTPLVYRLGEPGETLPTDRGDVSCAGLPVLADLETVRAAPWALGSPDDLVDADPVVFVCFLPQNIFRQVNPKNVLGRAVWLTWAYRFVFEKTCPGREKS